MVSFEARDQDIVDDGSAIEEQDALAAAIGCARDEEVAIFPTSIRMVAGFDSVLDVRASRGVERHEVRVLGADEDAGPVEARLEPIVVLRTREVPGTLEIALLYAVWFVEESDRV